MENKNLVAVFLWGVAFGSALVTLLDDFTLVKLIIMGFSLLLLGAMLYTNKR